MRVLALVIGICWQSIAQALPSHAPVPGGVALVELPVLGEQAQPEARFAAQPVLVVRDGGRWLAVVGLPIDQGLGVTGVEWQQGAVAGRVDFEVVDKIYPTQTLTVASKYVEPDPETLERIARERRRINEIKRMRSDIAPELGFVQPVDGPLSSRFGLRRVFNGQPRSPHLGLDIAAPAGAPVRAPAAGEVVEVGDFYFSGNLVAIDHGGGLLSLYGHLSRIDVVPGQKLRQGEVLGAVGATGRVTGAHLHWTVVLNRHSVDPELFLPTMTAQPAPKEP